MDFVRLVTHGLSAVSVHGEAVGVRLLVGTGALGVLLLGGVVAVVGVRLFTNTAIPGWATYTVGLLAVLLFQALTAFLVLAFMTLHARQSAPFLPVRDHHAFVEGVDELKPRT